jgi:amino acid adenylation domain-containing protein
MMVGLLGILKAGGAYVPLDPAYPDDRLTFMLKDSMAPVLLTQQNLVFRLPEIKDQNSENQHPTIICLDRDSDIISKEYTDNLRSGVHSKNLAYIIYTSGSTGKPKGVQVNHDSVVHLLKAIYPLFHFDENDIWTVFHSYAFDFSVWEIWGALLYGCRLVIVPQQMTQSPKNFYELLQREQVTVLNQTPSALYQLIKSKKESTHVKSELSLRHIICGGEDFPGKLASQLIEWKIPLWNFYGPTEATVWTTIHRVEGVKDKNRSVPIGKPITNAQVYLLDPLLQLVPVGIPGELYIGGAGLARGYHNRSELNSEKFIPNPFQNVSDARLYHTGDIARYLPDGTIEYIRRVDHQVKIRGFRIELGEIESLLQDHHAVQESVVIIKEYQQDDKRLIAYVVQSQGQKINDIELRHYLKTKVPEYMVPSVIAILEKMPLSSNGKIDRLAHLQHRVLMRVRLSLKKPVLIQ